MKQSLVREVGHRKPSAPVTNALTNIHEMVFHLFLFWLQLAWDQPLYISYTP